MIQDLRNIVEAWINDIKEMSNKDLEELKDKQSVINHMITEMKNMLEGINRGITEAENKKKVSWNIECGNATEQNIFKKLK